MWCGLVSCGVVSCGVVGYRAIGLPIWLVEGCWLLGTLGCLEAWVVCWVFGWLGHVVWCVHPRVLYDVVSVGTYLTTAILREGGGLIRSNHFCSSGVRGDCSSVDLAAF